MLSYAEAAPHAEEMADETLQHRMPPWLPDPGDYPIIGERRLTADQIGTIQRWVKGGKIEGNPSDLPPAPVFPGGWQLGKPDVVLTPARAYTLRPGGDDVYRNLVIHTALAKDVFVRALEFKTGGAPIHHAVIRVDTSGTMAHQDGQDGQPGVDGMAWQAGQDPEGHFIGWAPGRGPILSPDGMPWVLDRGADIVVELHLLPGKTPIDVKPTVALFLTDTPPVASPLTLKMSSRLIDIPAGATNYPVTDTFTLPASVDLLSVYPHAHYLGGDMLVTASLPEVAPSRRCSIFHSGVSTGSRTIATVTPISLPAGMTMTMKVPTTTRRPARKTTRRPPVRVRLGSQSTDEMAELGLQVLPKSLADAAALVQALVDHDTQANVAWAEQQVRNVEAQPRTAKTQADLGSACRPGGTIRRRRAAAQKLRPPPRGPSAAAEDDLGSALFSLGRVDEALLLPASGGRVVAAQRRAFSSIWATPTKRTSQPEAAAEACARAIAVNRFVSGST